MWFLYKGGMSQCPYWEDLRMIEPLCGDDTWSWKPWLLRPINWAQWVTVDSTPQVATWLVSSDFFVITHYKPILNLIDSQIFPVFFFSGGWSCDAPLHGAVDRCQDLLRYNQDWMGHLVQTGAASRAVSTVRRSLQCKHIIIQYI